MTYDLSDNDTKILDDNNVSDENIPFDSDTDMSSITTAYENKLLNKQCLPYDRNENNEYFLHNSMKYGNDNGPSFLVVLALCDTSKVYKHIKCTDVDLHLRITHFVSNLTRGQRSLFGLILDMVQDNSKNNNEYYYNNGVEVYKSNVLHTCDPIENWVSKILCIIHY